MSRPGLCSLLLLLAISLPNYAAVSADRIDLSPNVPPSGVSKILIELDAGGHNLVRPESEASKPQANAPTTDQKLPMSVSAKLKYVERRLAPSAQSTNGTPLAVRYYEQAEAVLKVDQSGHTPRLAAEHRLFVMENDGNRTSLYCVDGALPREQLDLVEVVGNSYFVDQLLPNKPVAEGDSWGHDAAVMGPFLALDKVAVCEVQSVLDGFNASFAKIRLEGVIHGMADGAATELDVRALYLYDRRLRRVTRLNLAIKENRSIGGATPGLDAVAKLQVTIEPTKSSDQLTDAIVAKATKARRTAARDVVYEAASLGFRIQHDRQWFVTSEQREAVTLRRVEQGDLIAQCTLTALPPKSAGRQISLEQFQKDVTYSLGKSFGEMVSSRQWQNAAGHFCFELVARGLVEEVPVEWHYYLIAPESGHRVSVAVTIEKPMIDRVADADRELVESLELFPRMPAAQTAARPSRKTMK